MYDGAENLGVLLVLLQCFACCCPSQLGGAGAWQAVACRTDASLRGQALRATRTRLMRVMHLSNAGRSCEAQSPLCTKKDEEVFQARSGDSTPCYGGPGGSFKGSERLELTKASQTPGSMLDLLHMWPHHGSQSSHFEWASPSGFSGTNQATSESRHKRHCAQPCVKELPDGARPKSSS